MLLSGDDSVRPQLSGYEAELCGKLNGLLTDEEIDSLRASSLNPHYTGLDVIRAIYGAIKRLGFASWGNCESSNQPPDRQKSRSVL